MTDHEHRALLERIANGDKDAFASLYRGTEKLVFGFIRSRLNDPFHANDILHEVFMQVWRSAGKFQGRSSVKTWMFGIAYRKTMDHFRKNAHEIVGDEIPDQADEGLCAFDVLSAKDEAAHVHQCLGTLSIDHRTALWLAFFEDMTYPEIGQVTNVPEGTAKTRVFHAKQLMTRCLYGLRKDRLA